MADNTQDPTKTPELASPPTQDTSAGSPAEAPPQDDLFALGPVTGLTSAAQLLVPAKVDLDEVEKNKAELYQRANLYLGPSGGSVLICPGNTDAEEFCPHSAKCPLLAARKAPKAEMCPFEANYVAQRFDGWAQEFGKNVNNVLESERAAISDLVWIDSQQMRIAGELAKIQNAIMTKVDVKEVDQNGQPIAFETKVHPLTELQDALGVRRNQILKAWELTPEMKSKKARWDKKGSGLDLSSQQSAKFDRIRKIARPAPED